MIVFDDMIADMLSNKKPNSILIELFIRERKLNIYFVYHTILFFYYKKYYNKFITLFQCQAKERFFTFQKESFRKNTKTNNRN